MDNEIQYIDRIELNGVTYLLRASIVEVYPTTCPKCGSSFELNYGKGKCDYCGTYYSTEFKLVESNDERG